MDLQCYDYCGEISKALQSGGIFLTAGKENPNTLTIGWGGLIPVWGRPVFMAMIRKSRHTHGLIEKTGEFTVSVPAGRDLKKALAFCGTQSGRDYDKFKEAGITAVPAKTVDTFIVGECGLHLECKVVYKQDMIPENLLKELDDRFYAGSTAHAPIQKDYHTYYFAEVTDYYKTNE